MSTHTIRHTEFLVSLVFIFLTHNVFAQEPDLIAGQNVNMVSGVVWPYGDPFLQRQNEPSIAVSSRNEMHLMAGSNDYRTVDLPGLPEGKTIGDSWVSTYFSKTGGGQWISTLLPGYPQDTSPQGLASPIHGYDATADPVIRSGTHGLFYYSGIAFTRDESPPSAGFVATFMDLNNNERENAVGYVRTTVFDQNADGSSFIDKPWIAVDKPRTGSQATFDVQTSDGTVSQTVECGNVYAAYARIQGDGSAAMSSQIMFTRSEDCAASFSIPIQVSPPDTINQGAAIAVDPVSGRIQIAWRQFENATLNCTRDEIFWGHNPEAWPVDELILAGGTYKHDDAAALFPGNDAKGGMPWLVLRQLLAGWLNVLSGSDSSEIMDTMKDAEDWLLNNPPGSKPKNDVKMSGNEMRVALRDFNHGATGPGRCDDLHGNGANNLLGGLNPNAIMVVTSSDFGHTFSAPAAVTGNDYYPFEQATTEFSFRTTAFPTMTFDGQGRSYIAYSTRGQAINNADTVSGDSRIVVTTSLDGIHWTTARAIDQPSQPGHQLMPALEFSRGTIFLLYYDFREDISNVFNRFIVDLSADPTTPRHSVDVRVAQASAADDPVFTDYGILNGGSTQTSRYPFLILENTDGVPYGQQLKYNPPNLPMFKGGNVPFFGDYIDLAALHFIKNSMGQWDFDTSPDMGAPVLHAVWTDNRDVVGPPDGDWTSYVPPGDGSTQASLFDPSRDRPACLSGGDLPGSDRTQMRNQNIYTSRLTQGLSVAIPGNNRPLGAIQRAFAGFIQNTTDQDKWFRLAILNQPAGGSASFDQFSLEIQMDVVIQRNSSISRTVFVSSSQPLAPVVLNVVEIDSDGGEPVANGLMGTATINPDSSAPAPDTGNILSEEVYTPAIFNPAIFNPAIFNPAIFNPAIFNPAIFNPAIFNPAIFNPAIFNPAIFNPAIFNPAIFNPAIFNPAIFNPAIFNPAIFNLDIENPAIFNPAIFNTDVANPAIFNSPLAEVSAEIRNDGNTTAAYSLNLDLENPPEGFLYQLTIYRIYLVPSAEGCDLTETVVKEALVNEVTPNMYGDLLDQNSTSFNIPPGDTVTLTVRVVPDPDAAIPGDPSMLGSFEDLGLTISVVPQAVDTATLVEGGNLPIPAIYPEPAPVLVSEDGPFGPGTVTLDTATGLRWLDLTLSTPYTYDQLLQQLLPGGVFAGYRLATEAEVLTLWQDAGIQTGAGFMNALRPENYQPIIDLMAFVGITGPNAANWGGGIFSDFTAGHIESGSGAGIAEVASLVLSPDPPPDEAGEPGIGTVVSNDQNDGHGAWLIPGTPPAITVNPSGWLPNPNATDGLFTWSNQFGRTDLYSVSIQTSSRSVPLSNPGWKTDDLIPIDPTQTYEASVWTYTDNGGVGHYPALQLYEADGTSLGTVGATGPSGYSAVNGAWVQRQFFIRPADNPGGVTAALARFIVVQDIETTQGTFATVFFDDAVLRINDGERLGPNLVLNPSFAYKARITNMVLDTTTPVINGPAVPYTINIGNFGAAMADIFVQAWIVQSDVTRNADFTWVDCDGAATFGDLPAGTCEFSYALETYGNVGDDILSLGPAEAVFWLITYDPDLGGRILDTFTVPITLIP